MENRKHPREGVLSFLVNSHHVKIATMPVNEEESAAQEQRALRLEREHFIAQGALPEVKRNGSAKVVPVERPPQIESDPDVEKVRGELRSLIQTELPYLDRKLLKDLNGEQLLNLYISYFNSRPSRAHFAEIVDRLGTEEMRDTSQEGPREAAYALYLLNKLPEELRQRRLSADREVSILKQNELEIPEQVTTEQLHKYRIASMALEALFNRREESVGRPILTFHVSTQEISDPKISVQLGRPQFNVNSPRPELTGNSKFFSFDPRKLYNPRGAERYLYLVYGSESDTLRIYDLAEGAATSDADLVRVDPEKLAPLPLTRSTITDLGVRLGKWS